MNGEDKSPEQLKAEIESIRKELLEYKDLKEELMAKRVTIKVTESFSFWMKVGGLVVSVATTIGVGVIVAYVLKFSQAEIKTQVDVLVPRLVTNLAPERVSSQIQTQLNSTEMIVFIHRQVQIQLASAKPLNGSFETNTIPRTNSIDTWALTNHFQVDYSAQMMPVRIQGDEGSVVGMACAAALECQIFRTTGKRVAISPRYIYNMVRKQEHTLDYDAGALLGDAIGFLGKNGAIEESAWPYKPGEYTNVPPASVAKAKRYYITKAKKLDSAKEIASALDSGPVVTGVTVFSSFEGQAVATTGMVPIPGATDTVAGGVVLCIVGYDSQNRLFKFKQCWGTDWGDHGYGYLPFEYVDRNIGESWTFNYKPN